MAEINKNLQPTQVIAKIFGVSTRRIEQLKTEGIIKGEGRPTKYDLLPTIQAYIKYLSDKANGREKKQTDSELETSKLEAESRYKTAKADMAELELRELRGELHRASDVEAITTDHVMLLRSMLMALPGRWRWIWPQSTNRQRRRTGSVRRSMASWTGWQTTGMTRRSTKSE